MPSKYDTLQGKQQEEQKASQDLAQQLETFLSPLLLVLDTVLDKRLVRTVVQTCVAILRFRNSQQGLLLSELGSYMDGYQGYSCSAPAGVTCSFSPATITPGGSGAMSTMTITVASTYSPMVIAAVLPFGLAGLLLAGDTRRRFWTSGKLRTLALGAVLLTALIAVGCSGGNSNRQMSASSAATVMVTGTSGTVMHSVPVTVNIH